jgi:hypothetical protein
MSPQYIADILNNSTMLTAAAPYMQPVPVAKALMASNSFIHGLLNLMNPATVADILNSSIDLVRESTNYTDPGFVADLVSNRAMLSRVLGLLDVEVLAEVANANPQMTSDLMPLLSPAAGAGMAGGINSNPALIVEALNALNPAIVANALNAHPEISEKLSSLMPPSLGQPIAQGLSGNPAFLGELLKNLDAAPIAAALSAHTDFIYNLLSQISPSVTAAMVRGSNRNPAFLASVISNLDPNTVAGALNKATESINPTFMTDLLANLGGAMGEAISQGTTENWMAGKNFLEAVIRYLNPAVIAGAVNANPGFLKGFLAATSPTTAMYLARGINANVDKQPMGQDLLSVLIANVSEDAAVAMAQGINQNVSQNGVADNFLTGMLANTSGPVGVAIANGLNSNPGFIQSVVANISPDTAEAAAKAINLSCQKAKANPKYAFLRKLLANLGPEAAAQSAKGLEANSEIEPLVSNLLIKLNGPLVAEDLVAGLNANASSKHLIKGVLANLNATTGVTIAIALNANQKMTEWMLGALDPKGIADLLKDNTPFLSSLISNLDGSVIAEAINQEYQASRNEPDDKPFLEALMAEMNGADTAKLLNEYGFNFISGLVENLNGEMVAKAINESPKAVDFLSELIAYMDPYDVAALTSRSNPNGALKDLWIYVVVYWSNLNFGQWDSYLVYKMLDAGVWVPPDAPDWPYW